MKVELLHYTPLIVAVKAIRTCWSSMDKSDSQKGMCGEKDLALIDRVGNKNKHSSTLEHLNFNFFISGISRALLQELARHRIASYSVKSTRYTLKELKKEVFKEDIPTAVNISDVTYAHTIDQIEQFSKYLVWTDNTEVNKMSIKALLNLQTILNQGVANDKAKFCLPENYKTELMWTINLRSLQSLLSLRLNKAALWEFQDLCCKIVQALPKEHLFLVEDIVKKQINENERIAELIKVFD